MTHYFTNKSLPTLRFGISQGSQRRTWQQLCGCATTGKLHYPKTTGIHAFTVFKALDLGFERITRIPLRVLNTNPLHPAQPEVHHQTLHWTPAARVKTSDSIYIICRDHPLERLCWTACPQCIHVKPANVKCVTTNITGYKNDQKRAKCLQVAKCFWQFWGTWSKDDTWIILNSVS